MSVLGLVTSLFVHTLVELITPKWAILGVSILDRGSI